MTMGTFTAPLSSILLDSLKLGGGSRGSACCTFTRREKQQPLLVQVAFKPVTISSSAPPQAIRYGGCCCFLVQKARIYGALQVNAMSSSGTGRYGSGKPQPSLIHICRSLQHCFFEVRNNCSNTMVMMISRTHSYIEDSVSFLQLCFFELCLDAGRRSGQMKERASYRKQSILSSYDFLRLLFIVWYSCLPSPSSAQMNVMLSSFQEMSAAKLQLRAFMPACFEEHETAWDQSFITRTIQGLQTICKIVNTMK